MGTKKRLFLGSIVSGVSLVLAPRLRWRRGADGQPRRSGRGALASFQGTPCSYEQPRVPAAGEPADGVAPDGHGDPSGSRDSALDGE
jgi:hypothetical protein